MLCVVPHSDYTMTTQTNDTNATQAHPFERAGLGKAPFRFVGMVQQDLCYGERILNRAEYERTGISLTTKPGGTCAYCGTYIVNMFQIKSADGRCFHVGCDCVNKTGDRKLMLSCKQAVLRAGRQKRAALAERKAGELAAMLANESVRAKLANKPHPKPYMAAKGETLLAWADWMAKHAGAAGRAKVLKAIKS